MNTASRSTISLIIMALAAAPSMACGRESTHVALISNSPPPALSPGMFVAEIELIGGDPFDLYGSGLRARVKRVLQGPPEVTELILKLQEETDCDYPFGNGRSGFLVGKLKPGGGSFREVEPVMKRLLDRFKIPEQYRRK